MTEEPNPKFTKKIRLSVTPAAISEIIAGRIVCCECDNPLQEEYKFKNIYYEPEVDLWWFIYATDDCPEGYYPVVIPARTFKRKTLGVNKNDQEKRKN